MFGSEGPPLGTLPRGRGMALPGCGTPRGGIPSDADVSLGSVLVGGDWASANVCGSRSRLTSGAANCRMGADGCAFVLALP